MTRTIHRYTLEITDLHTQHLPTGARPLSTGMDGRGALCLWAQVDPEQPTEPWHVRIVGTGHPAADLDDWLFLGTTLMDGFLVWHVFVRRVS